MRVYIGVKLKEVQNYYLTNNIKLRACQDTNF